METLPWYKQFWPWFLLLLPASVVVAGITTVIIAARHADSLVVDNYYREGLAINKSLEKQNTAARNNIRARLTFDGLTGEVFLSLAGDMAVFPAQLVLQLDHPLNQKRDLTLELNQQAPGRYRSALAEPLSGRWYAKLYNVSASGWLLKSEFQFDANRDTQHFELVAHKGNG